MDCESELTDYAVCMAVAKRARQITTNALIRGILLDRNAVELASYEFERNEFQVINVE